MSRAAVDATKSPDTAASATSHASGPAVRAPDVVRRNFRHASGGKTPHRIATGYAPAKSIALKKTSGDVRATATAGSVAYNAARRGRVAVGATSDFSASMEPSAVVATAAPASSIEQMRVGSDPSKCSNGSPRATKPKPRQAHAPSSTSGAREPKVSAARMRGASPSSSSLTVGTVSAKDE